MIKTTWILIVCALTAGAAAQVSHDTKELERQAATRIARLAALLDPDHPANAGVDFDDEHREKLTASIRAEVTNFIQSAIPASSSQETVQTRLRALLATQEPSREYGELPKARIATLRYGRSLVVSYTVVRPPHFDTSLVFAFIEDGGRFRRVATAGEDFDGYTMFSFDVPSPVSGELWFLVGGRAHTFNGSKFRYRMYSFNGGEFRTVWSRDDVFNGRLQLLPGGFAINYVDRRSPSWPEVTETYALNANGVFQVK